MRTDLQNIEDVVSGPVPPAIQLKAVTIKEFAAMFDESVHGAINDALGRYPDKEAVVCCENLDMCSSAFGQRSALIVGPSNTFTLADVQKPGFRLGDLPSRFQYPVVYVDYRKQSVWRIKHDVQQTDDEHHTPVVHGAGAGPAA